MSWRYKTYASANGRSDVQKHIDRLNAQAKYRFEAELRWLRDLSPREWHEPHAKKLKGYDHLYEIRFTANKVRQRPIGFFGPDPGDFTILVWATHKQDIYDPAEALDTAEGRRKSLVVSKTASAAPLAIDGEPFPAPEG
jgi:hypothetical protein